MTESKVVSFGQVVSINELGQEKARICLEGSPLVVEVVNFDESPGARGIGVGQYLLKHEDGRFTKSVEPPAEKKPETYVFSKKHEDVRDPMVWPGDNEAKQVKAEERHAKGDGHMDSMLSKTMDEGLSQPFKEAPSSKHEKHHGKVHK